MNKMPDKANEMRNDHQGCIVSSPVTTLMSSLNRRVKPSSIRAKRRKMSSRSNNNGRGSSSSVHVDTEYECCDSLSTTNWVEVLFLQTGQFNSKHFHAQGGKKDIMDVAITPEWRPSSPTDNKLSGTVEVDSPKRLLPASFMKVTPSSDSQGQLLTVLSINETQYNIMLLYTRLQPCAIVYIHVCIIYT